MGGGGGGVFEIGNPEGKGGGCSSSFGNPGRREREGVQKYAFHQGCVWIFSGITHSTFFSFTYVTKEMVNSSMCHIG